MLLLKPCPHHVMISTYYHPCKQTDATPNIAQSNPYLYANSRFLGRFRGTGGVSEESSLSVESLGDDDVSRLGRFNMRTLVGERVECSVGLRREVGLIGRPRERLVGIVWGTIGLNVLISSVCSSLTSSMAPRDTICSVVSWPSSKPGTSPSCMSGSPLSVTTTTSTAETSTPGCIATINGPSLVSHCTSSVSATVHSTGCSLPASDSSISAVQNRRKWRNNAPNRYNFAQNGAILA